MSTPNLSVEPYQSTENNQPTESMQSPKSAKSRQSVNTQHPFFDSSKVFVIEAYVPPEPTYYVFLVDLESPSPSPQGRSAIFVQREEEGEEEGEYIYPSGLDSTTKHTGGRLLGTTRKAFYSEIQKKIQEVEIENPSSEGEAYNADWMKTTIIPALKKAGILTLTVQTVYMLEPEREYYTWEFMERSSEY